MGSYQHPRVFDPLDLQIIELVYEAAWTQLALRNPSTNPAQHEQEALRKLIFAIARPGNIEFDSLLDTVLVSFTTVHPTASGGRGKPL